MRKSRERKLREKVVRERIIKIIGKLKKLKPKVMTAEIIMKL